MVYPVLYVTGSLITEHIGNRIGQKSNRFISSGFCDKIPPRKEGKKMDYINDSKELIQFIESSPSMFSFCKDNQRNAGNGRTYISSGKQ